MTDHNQSDTLIPDEGLAPASTALPTADVMEELATPPRSQWRDVWDQFKTHKGAMIGAILFIFIVAAVYLGPYLWTIDPTQIDIRSRNQGPKLGTPVWHRSAGPGYHVADDVGWSDLGFRWYHRDAAGPVPGIVRWGKLPGSSNGSTGR